MARSRNYPMLQKSPSGLCEIEICNYRIGAPVLLNRCCAFRPNLESIFLAEMLKILLQHNLPKADVELEMSAGTISIENSSAWAKLLVRDNGEPRSKNALPRRNASWEWRR